MNINKPRMLKIVNVVLFFSVLNQVVTGLASDLLNSAVFGIVHPLGGIVTAVFAAAHVALNWAWVKATFLK